MVPLDAQVKGVAALVSVAFAVVILAAGRRRAAEAALAAFFVLIAGNQAAETVRALAPTPEAALGWFRVATVFAALDPVVLALGAALLSSRGLAPRRVHLALLALAAVGLSLVAPRMLPAEAPDAGSALANLALAAYTAYAYVLAFAWVAEAPPEGAGPGARRYLLAALAVAAIPVCARAAARVGTAAMRLGWLPTDTRGLAVGLALTLAAALLAALLMPRASGRPQEARAAVLAGLAFALANAIPPMRDLLSETGIAPGLPSTQFLAQASASFRWLLVGALLSTAIIRERVLGTDVASRRMAARVLLGVTFVTGAGVLLLALEAVFGAHLFGLNVAEGATLLIALLASQGFRGLVDAAAHRFYGVPRPGDAATLQEAYREAALAAARVGRLGRDPALERLRDELGIDPRVAAAIERVAESTVAGPLQPGHVVAGRYHVVRLLARGAGGRVFLARDALLGRDLALKEVPLDGEGREPRALSEARAAGAVQHPNVLILHDCLLREGACILVTEHAAGGSLDDRLAAQGPLPAHEALPLLDGILAGLSAVHARGILHRDLKPANVLLSADGTPKLADFGLARLDRGETMGEGEPVGTPGYVAPELLAGRQATPASDLYAVGQLARKCIAAPLPPPLERVVARATARRPEDRYASADEMLAALRAAAPQAQ